MAIERLPTIALIDINLGLTPLVVVGFPDDDVEGKYASALALAVRAVTDRDGLQVALQHVSHGPTQAAAIPILHIPLHQTMVMAPSL
jgi:hypothetical protein